MAPNSKQRFFQSLKKFDQDQIMRAGARYTPSIDPSAPNIPNDALSENLYHLACGPEVDSRCSENSLNLRDRWHRARQSFDHPGKLDIEIESLTTLITNSVVRIREGEVAVRNQIVGQLKEIGQVVSAEESRLEQIESTAIERLRSGSHLGTIQAPQDSSQLNTLRSNLHNVRDIRAIIEELGSLYEGLSGELLVRRFCLIRGQWGTGKTHFLCDFAGRQLKEGRPILLLLAKNFMGSKGILDTVARNTQIANTMEELLDYLNQWGKEVGERILIVIDGINEGQRNPWLTSLDKLADYIASRLNLALVVSCRTPFEDLALSKNIRSQMVELIHSGFSDQEFDAQKEFFQFYKIPLPEVPLLNEEFSRPLTLKLICEAFQGLKSSKLKKGFFGVASGQKGMTFVLETFVNRIGKSIEKSFDLPPKACWEILKGKRISDTISVGIAPYMAATLKEYVGKRAALGIIGAQHPLLPPRKRSQLLEEMRINGLLDEDVVWTMRNKKPKGMIAFRLPYQRFSDHLIARHLLENYLDKSSKDSLRTSFAMGKPLGNIFQKKKHYLEYSRPGWAEALMVEFPEAVKRLKELDRELFFFLPKRASDLNYYYTPFVQGLFWRAPTSFSNGTNRILSALLEHDNEQVWQQTMDSLVGISIKPGHPCSAKALYDYLANYEMATRDKRWTEYIRRTFTSQSVVRLFAWVEATEKISLPAKVTSELIVLLSLVLTTVVRKDRDVATRALVHLGEKHSGSLFQHTLNALSFNDPYVSERLLAACYGVTLSKHAIPRQTGFKKSLFQFARKLYEQMFTKNAPYGTHHTLMRDYALGVIRTALSINPTFLSEIERLDLEPPFAQICPPFPEPEKIVDEQCIDGKSAILMDFGNYTIGRLIPGRSNYDVQNIEYQRVCKQIEWRIGNLGYKQSDFEAIDKEILNRSFYSEQDRSSRVDRYGKKYSWISFFEMYGLRDARGLLAQNRALERSSDCDIDPSFPKPPPGWRPPIPSMFVDSKINADDWVSGGWTPDFHPLLRISKINGHAGPWILLQGFVHRQDRGLNREIFTFLRGLFLRKSSIDWLRDKFLNIEYPGNNQIPDGPEDYYLFAGEAGISPRFAPGLKLPNGRYRRYVQEAFSGTKFIPTPSKQATNPKGKSIVVKFLVNTQDGLNTKTESGEDEFFIPLQAGKWKKIPGVRVEIPYRRYSWESYHSAINSYSGFMLPAASIIAKLNLRTWHREIDFRDSDGQYATLYREQVNKHWDGNTHSLLYIREDCLRRYLTKTRQTIVWCNWGERDYVEKGNSHNNLSPERSRIYQNHLHIHRRFHEYESM